MSEHDEQAREKWRRCSVKEAELLELAKAEPAEPRELVEYTARYATLVCELAAICAERLPMYEATMPDARLVRGPLYTRLPSAKPKKRHIEITADHDKNNGGKP